MGGTPTDGVRRLGMLLTIIDLITRFFRLQFLNILGWFLFLPYFLRFNLVVLNEWSDYWPDWLEYIFTLGNSLPLRDVADFMGEMALMEGIPSTLTWAYNTVFKFPFFDFWAMIPLAEWILIIWEQQMTAYWNFTEFDIWATGVLYCIKVAHWFTSAAMGFAFKVLILGGIVAATGGVVYVYLTME